MKLKKGDKVVVIAGKDRGKSGNIVHAFPKENLIVVEGINMHTKHRKATARSRKGQIVQLATPIHASNVMIADPKSGKPTRVGISREKDGRRGRVAKASGQTL